MNVFDLELRSSETGQKRLLTLEADSKDHARELAEDLERRHAEFSLDIPDKDYWEQPPGTRDDEDDGLVDASRWDAYDPAWREQAQGLSYDEAKRANEKRLEDFRSRLDIHDGKVRSRRLGRHTTARLMAHLQQEPYEVLSIDEVAQKEIERQQIVSAFRDAIAKHDPMADPGNWDKVIQEIRQKGYPTAVVTAQVHGVGVQAQDNGGTPIVWGTGSGGDVIRTSLHTGYTADPDTHQFWSSTTVSSTEITGTGYTAASGGTGGGVALATKTTAYDTSTDQTRLGAANVSWTTSTLSATDAIVRKDSGTSTTSPVYGSIDFAATVTTTAGTFQITWDATGIIVRDYT